MNFRVLSGDALASAKPSERAPVRYWQGEDVAVEGAPGAVTAALADGRTAILFGRVECVRDGLAARGSSHPSHDLVLAVEAGLEAAARMLDGRWVLVVAGPDGVVIRADRFGRADVFLAEGACAGDIELLPEAALAGGPDQMALAHLVTVYGWRAPKRHTTHQGVRRLGPGETLSMGGIRDGEVRGTPFTPTRSGAFGARELREYADLLLSAVEARGSADGNVVLLSSGWDSTALLACLVHVFGARRVRAVTGRMRYSERSGVCNAFEIERAGRMAEYFGVRLDWADLDYVAPDWDVIDQIRPVFRRHEVYSLTGVNHAMLAAAGRRTADGDEVLFNGEISDGAHNLGFSQFTTIFHPVLEFREYSDKMASYVFGPSFLRALRQGTHAQDPVYGLLRGQAGDARFDEPADTDIARTRQLLSSFFLRSVRLPLWSMANARSLTPAGAGRYLETMEAAYLAEAAERATPEDLYAWYLHLYNSFHWQGSTVASFALAAEQWGFDFALPFWDAGIQEFLSAMPESWGRGLDLNPTKYPLKWVLQNVVRYPYELQQGEHSYTYDRDHNFNHSVEVFHHSGLSAGFRQALQDRPYRELLDPGIFDLAFLDALVERYVAGDELSATDLNDVIPLALVAWMHRS